MALATGGSGDIMDAPAKPAAAAPDIAGMVLSENF